MTRATINADHALMVQVAESQFILVLYKGHIGDILGFCWGYIRVI